jgi:hypothetical protein
MVENSAVMGKSDVTAKLNMTVHEKLKILNS